MRGDSQRAWAELRRRINAVVGDDDPDDDPDTPEAPEVTVADGLVTFHRPGRYLITATTDAPEDPPE